MNFKNEKLIQLRKSDKSKKGSYDRKISGLIKKINSSEDYYTTSSCAGRLLLIKELGKKSLNQILFFSHEGLSLNKLKKALNQAIKNFGGLIYFKQEPCILHVACSSLKKAEELLNKARNSGWKRSGIIAIKRIICEMVSTEWIVLPIANKGKILLEDDYIKLALHEANKKLSKTWGKIRGLEKIF